MTYTLFTEQKVNVKIQRSVFSPQRMNTFFIQIYVSDPYGNEEISGPCKWGVSITLDVIDCKGKKKLKIPIVCV